MQKIYSLLRNNKQTGSYTIEELLDLSLKSFDLVWIEGKSGSWSYPSEIEELKPYLTETSPTSSELKEQYPTLQPTRTPLATETEVKDKVETIHSSKHIYISFPAGGSSGNTLKHNYTQLSSEEESPEVKLERKAQELRNKIQAFAEGKKMPKADNELDTKFSRSLEDIKEEYSDWLHHQKTKRTVPYKKIFIGAVSVLFALFIGYFISNNLPTSKSLTNKEMVILQKVEPAVYEESINEHNPAVNVGSKEKTKTSTKKPTQSTSLAKKQTTSTSRIDKYIDSLRKAENKSIEALDESPVGENVSDQQPISTSPTANKTPTIDKTKTSTESSESFAQQVRLSESTGDGAPKLTIYNNSNRFINFVAVDVSYYKANNKLLERKTLYFHNISANTSSPLYVPEMKKATTVKYQIGLISTDNGLFYAKQ